MGSDVLPVMKIGWKVDGWRQGSQIQLNLPFFPDDDRDSNGNLIPSCFRKYPTVRDSYIDHSNFLMYSENYAPLFSYDKTEYVLWAQGLSLCRYASDERYAEKLIRTIETYDLYELDYYTIEFVERLPELPIQGQTSSME